MPHPVGLRWKVAKRSQGFWNDFEGFAIGLQRCDSIEGANKQLAGAIDGHSESGSSGGADFSQQLVGCCRHHLRRDGQHGIIVGSASLFCGTFLVSSLEVDAMFAVGATMVRLGRTIEANAGRICRGRDMEGTRVAADE